MAADWLRPSELFPESEAPCGDFPRYPRSIYKQERGQKGRQNYRGQPQPTTRRLRPFVRFLSWELLRALSLKGVPARRTYTCRETMPCVSLYQKGLIRKTRHPSKDWTRK